MPAQTLDKRIFNGGAGRGQGRLPGGKNKLTMMKEKALAEAEKHIAKMTQKIVNSQAIAALGTHKMVVLTRDSDGKVNIETVRDEKRMQSLLDEGEYGKDYLIVDGRESDWRAGDSLLNRVHGMPKQKVEHSGGVGVLHLIKQLDSDGQEDAVDN